MTKNEIVPHFKRYELESLNSELIRQELNLQIILRILLVEKVQNKEILKFLATFS